MAINRFCLLLVTTTFLPHISLQISPTVNVTCGLGPKYTFDVTGASTEGLIFISAKCEAQNTTSSSLSTFVFEDGVCTTGGVPAFEETFKLVIQEFPFFNLDTDYILEVTCYPDFTAKTSEVSTSTSPKAADGSQDVQLTPTFTTKLLDSGGNEVTSGTIGNEVTMEVGIGAGMIDIFDYYLDVLEASANGTTVTVVTNGCSLYPSVFAHPPRQFNGIIQQIFALFIPVNSLNDPTTPQAPTVVKFTLMLTICSVPAGGCAVPSCSSRRRRSVETSDGFANETTELTTQILVYQPDNDVTSVTDGHRTEADDYVRLSVAGLVGLLFGFLSILAVGMITGACLFARFRRLYHKEVDCVCSSKSLEK